MFYEYFVLLLKVLGYRVVASSSTSVKQDYNEYVWTMRKEFNEPEPYLAEAVQLERDNKINSGKQSKTNAPE